jgi:hypothetical protein
MSSSSSGMLDSATLQGAMYDFLLTLQRHLAEHKPDVNDILTLLVCMTVLPGVKFLT